MRDKYQETANQCYEPKSDRPYTLRQRLETDIAMSENSISTFQNQISKCKAALKMLDKNPDLETLVDLLKS